MMFDVCILPKARQNKVKDEICVIYLLNIALLDA